MDIAKLMEIRRNFTKHGLTALKHRYTMFSIHLITLPSRSHNPNHWVVYDLN